MSKKAQLKQLKQRLVNLKAENLASWQYYGSELCTGDLIRQESNLQLEILKLEEEIKNEGQTTVNNN